MYFTSSSHFGWLSLSHFREEELVLLAKKESIRVPMFIARHVWHSEYEGTTYTKLQQQSKGIFRENQMPILACKVAIYRAAANNYRVVASKP